MIISTVKMDNLDIAGMLKMAHRVAKQASSSITDQEKEDIKNMSEEEAIAHVTQKVMGMVGNMDLDHPYSEPIECETETTITVDIPITDILKGFTKKVRYKRFVDDKQTKEKVVLTMEPMHFSPKVVFSEKGDDGLDLCVNLNVVPSPSISLDKNHNLLVKEYKKFSDILKEINVPELDDLSASPENAIYIKYILKEKGLFVDSKRTNVVIDCYNMSD